MKIDDISAEWAKDCELDITAIGENAMAIGRLHNKYYRIYLHEKALHSKYSADLKVLLLEKREFYVQGPSKETEKMGWKHPAIGKVIKTEVEIYVNADPDVINLTLKIGLQKDKYEFLMSIIGMIIYRNQHLKVALDDIKFKSGVI